MHGVIDFNAVGLGAFTLVQSSQYPLFNFLFAGAPGVTPPGRRPYLIGVAVFRPSRRRLHIKRGRQNTALRVDAADDGAVDRGDGPAAVVPDP